MTTFDKMGITEATQVVGDNKFEDFDSNNDFFEGDHWQRGSGFLDDVPPPSHLATSTIETGLARIFATENVIRQVVKRRVDGILSSAPKIIANRGAGKDRKQDADIQLAIAEWIRKRKINEKLRALVRMATLHDKAYLRIIVPEGRTASMSRVSDPIEALDLIFVDAVGRDQAAIHVDPRTLGECAVYTYSVDLFDVRDPALKSSITPKTNRAEISYVDMGTGETVFRVVDNTSGANSAPEISERRLHLRGNVMLIEVCGLLLVTETVRRQQKAIGTTRTHMMVNNKATDWQRRVFFNAQPPGSIIKDPVSGEEITVDDSSLASLPGTDLYLRGISEETADGERIKDPSMKVIDPGTVERFRQSEASNRQGILRECHQLHVELGDDATSTGEARAQAMEDFEKDLKHVKGELDDAGARLLDTVWALANWMAGKDIKDDDVSFVFDSLITIGHIDNDRRRVSMEEVRTMLISRSTAVAERGIEDPEAEMLLIDSDPYQQMLFNTGIAEAVKKLVDAGASLRGALEMMGVEESLIKKLEEIDLPADPDMDAGLPGDGLPGNQPPIVAPGGGN